MISFCGMDCEHCDAFVATKTCDSRLRLMVAQDWSKIYGRAFTAEEVNCGGCTCVGTHGIYCDTMCRVKPCCQEKKLPHCGYCDVFPCEKLEEIFAFYPDAKQRIRESMEESGKD